MKTFSTLDAISVFIYMAAIVILGSSFYRRKSDAQEYFLGGRGMSWIPVGISIIAADMSAISVMGSPAWAYAHNLELIWPTVGYLIAAPLVLMVFVPLYSRLNLYTAYEYLEQRFNLGVRLVASFLFLALRSLHVAVVIYAPALVLTMLTGLPTWQCVLFIGAVTTFYTALGGMKAVIWTDVIQFVTVTAGILAVFAVILIRLDVPLAEAIQQASAAGRLSTINLSLDPAEVTSLWACILGGIVLSMGPLTTDQAVLQRLFTTKSQKDCRQSVILQSIVIIPITLILNFVGVALYVHYQRHPDRLAGLTNNDAILPFFVIRELPDGISGLVIASIFAASMAVMSAGINALSTASIVDFYGRLWKRGADSEHYASAGRVSTVVWGVIVTVIALFADRLGELAMAYNKASSIISGPLLGIFLLATLTKNATSYGALFGSLAGAISVALVSTVTNWSFFYLGPIGVFVTWFAGWVFSAFDNQSTADIPAKS